jgi:hypothetical protein
VSAVEGKDVSTRPRLSAVLGAPFGIDTVRLTLEHLARQSIAREMELILVAGGEPGDVELPTCTDAIGECRVIDAGPARAAGAVNAIGVRAARAPLVVLCEDHCFPDSGWAAALVAAFDAPDVVAAAPVVANANPGTAVSRADFMIGYGPWMEPTRPGEVEFLPGHNSCYRREVLLGLGERLEPALDAEAVLHGRLRSRGLRLVIASDARVFHTNFSRFGPWLAVMSSSGRLFAARRAGQWSGWRRAMYALGSPLIPAVRFARTHRHCRRRGLSMGLRTAATLLLGLAVDGWGQMVGYATGHAPAVPYCADFGRTRFLTDRDLGELAERVARLAGAAVPADDETHRGAA